MSENVIHLVEEFVEKNNMDSVMDQWRVVREERHELDKELTKRHFGEENNVAEEIADEMITLMVLGEIMDINYTEELIKKMKYNVQKTGEKDENGKVIDDVA